MKVMMMPLGVYETNCYVVYDENTLEAAVIDPGAEGKGLIKILEENKLDVKKILLTHGHSDHIGAVQAVADRYKVPVYIHPNDSMFLKDPKLNLSVHMGLSITCDVEEKPLIGGDKIEAAGVSFTVLETPGHTGGGVCFYGGGIVFAGDTLFQGSIGRTDFPGGSFEQLDKAIRTQLYTLPPDTIVCPGHGPTTTVGDEMKYNPFVSV